jgi:hypothetical protein
VGKIKLNVSVNVDSLPEDRIAYWNEYNKRFVELIYPTLFKPFGIAFNTAYSVWAECCLENNSRTPGPPDTVVITEEDKEEWEK